MPLAKYRKNEASGVAQRLLRVQPNGKGKLTVYQMCKMLIQTFFKKTIFNLKAT